MSAVAIKLSNLVEHYAVSGESYAFLKKHGFALKNKVDFLYLNPPVVEEVKGKLKTQLDRWEKYLRQNVELSVPLLSGTGIIVAPVNDRELPRFRNVLDELVGYENFIGMITVDTGNVANNVRFLSSSHHYLLVYAKNLAVLQKTKIKWRQKREGLESLRKQERKLRSAHGDNYEAISAGLKEWFLTQNLPKRLKAFTNADTKGLYTYSDLSAPQKGPTYSVVNPETGNEVAVPTRGWAVSEVTFQNLIETDQIIWGTTDSNQPLKKLYLKDDPDQVLRTVFTAPSRSPERLLTNILGEDLKDKLKDVHDLDLVKHILDTMSSRDAVILDLYSKYGTTGHAVLDLNYETGSQRRVILVSSGVWNTTVVKPRMEAVITGKWSDRQHRPRRAVLKTQFSQL